LKYNAFCPWHFGDPFSLELPNVITWFFCYYSFSGFFFSQGGSDWKSDILIIGGYGSWSWKSYNLVVVVGKKRKSRGIDNNRRKRNDGIRHTNNTKKRNGIKNQQRKTLIIKIWTWTTPKPYERWRILSPFKMQFWPTWGNIRWVKHGWIWN